ncbi:MAG: hypothetical protein WCX61_05655 [Candidatus Peribacteraceae bacterium]
MQARFTTALGLPVVEERHGETVGHITGMLLHPDTGTVEGFYVSAPAMFGTQEFFCAAQDIIRWGAFLAVRSAEALSLAEEHIRLQPLLEDGRTILGQHIRTQSGVHVGICRDVQFSTESMKLTWLFPKRWWRWGTAIPVSEIIEVLPDAVVVRDPIAYEKESIADVGREALEKLQEITDPGIARPSRSLKRR